MYDSAYHLNSDPFRLCPDRRFCFNHKSYAKNKTYLDYALQRGEGFVMITGAPGSGKTTLLNDVLNNDASNRTIVAARIVTTQLNADDLLRMVAFAFKIKTEGLDKASIIQQLEEFLIEQYQRKRKTLLVIDEAQDLNKHALEEMRLLTNLQFRDHPLLQVFLVGQNNLLDIVQDPSMAQLHQRMIASSHLEPMNLEETGTYIMHRLRISGWHHDPMFTRGAVKRIFFFSRGVPRIVNQFCSRFLLYGAVENKHQLDSYDAQEVINELTQEHLAPILDTNSLTVPYNDGTLSETDESFESLDEQYLDYDEDPTERIIDEIIYQDIHHTNVTPIKSPNKHKIENHVESRKVEEIALEDISAEPSIQTPFPGYNVTEADETTPENSPAYGADSRDIPTRSTPAEKSDELITIPYEAGKKKYRQYVHESYLKATATIVFLAIFLIIIFPRGNVENQAKSVKSDTDIKSVSLQQSLQESNQPLQDSKIFSRNNFQNEFKPNPPQQTKTSINSMMKKAAINTSSNLPVETLSSKIALSNVVENKPQIPVIDEQNKIKTTNIPNQHNNADLIKEDYKSVNMQKNTANTMALREFSKLPMNIDAQFPRGSAEMTTAMRENLTQVAKILKNKGASVVHIIGYCDRTGSQERNVYLSVRRADAVANILVREGFPRNKIFTEGHGSNEIISLTNPSLNRRVEIYLKGANPKLASKDS